MTKQANTTNSRYRVSPKKKQGLIQIFFRKIISDLILRGYHLFSFIKNKIAQQKITRFSNTQNLKTDIHLLINNTFLLKTAVHRLNSGVIFMLSQVIELFSLPHLSN